MILDGVSANPKSPRVLRKGHPLFSLLATSVLALAATARAAIPFRQATVTRVENKVSYGEVKGDRSALRPATAEDVVKASNFLQSESDSRAELKYEDGSLVRIGQNTIFSFDAITRTLSLTKGTFIFYVPKSSGGASVKTPSLTAAITGTIAKVSPNYIAVLEGVIRLVPSGRIVAAGQFARFNGDGTITIDFFDPTKALDGKLVSFNGPLPGLDEKFSRPDAPGKPDLSLFDSLERTQNQPNGLNLFNPQPEPPPPMDHRGRTIFVPPPQNMPPPPSGGRPPY